jgi:hypothetical protein
VQLGKPVEGDSIRGYDVTCHLDSSSAMVTDGDLQRHGPFSARRVGCGDAGGDADQYRRRRYGM